MEIISDGIIIEFGFFLNNITAKFFRIDHMITFAQLAKHYPTVAEFSHDALFVELGWHDLIRNPAFTNTCAIRLSYCLIRAGITIPGRIKIKAGPHKGKLIEPGQVKLSNILANPQLFGKPVKFKPGDLASNLKGKQGIISFMRIPGYVIDGALSGHIDLVHHERFFYFWDKYVCASSCYWQAAECLFWPLGQGEV